MKKLLITLLFVGIIGTALFPLGIIDAGSETISSNMTLSTVNGGDTEYHMNKQVNNFRRSLPILFPLVGFGALIVLGFISNKRKEPNVNDK